MQKGCQNIFDADFTVYVNDLIVGSIEVFLTCFTHIYVVEGIKSIVVSEIL